MCCTSDFLSHNDNVFRDLTIDRALELNDDIEIQPNVLLLLCRRQDAPEHALPASARRPSI